MTTKQRDVIFQRWSGVIRRETTDTASLERVGAQAVSDRDVRDDATLLSLIRGELEQRRSKLEQELQSLASSKIASESRPTSRSEPPTPAPQTTPAQDRVAFNRLAQNLCVSLERGDERETHALLGKMCVMQERSPEVIPAALIADYEQRVFELRAHLRQLTDRIAALTQQTVAASRSGNEQDLARAMSHLLAIHAAHPALLDEAGLDEIRGSVVRAADERRQHQSTTRKLLERERIIAAEIKKLAAAVHEFHRVACTVPGTGDEFRHAEAAYLRTVQQVQAYDTEWFSGVVLELADLLAEWTLPPLEAEGQIDRFLDSIHKGVENIRKEMQKIENEQDSRQGDSRESAAPQRLGGK